MTLSFKKIFRGDSQLWAIFFTLIAISFLEVFSASSTLAYRSGMLSPILSHTKFIVISVAIVWGLSRCPVKLFRAGVLLYVVGLICQFVVLVHGEEVNEAARWITIFGQKFQPSEILKPGMVFLGAAIYTSKSWGKPEIRFWWYMGLMGFPVLLIAMDNLSTGVILTAFVFLFAWFCDAPAKSMRHALIAVVAIGAVGLLMLLTLPSETLHKIHRRADTWQSRIVGKKDSAALGGNADSLVMVSKDDPSKFVFTKENFQPANAKIAIARSRGIGVGPGHSLQRDVLPQAYSDYIYAITIEEYGLLGMLVLPLLFAWFYWRISKIAGRTRDLHSRYTLLGFGVLYMLQAITNFAVAAGVFPVTGQTLPLVSRGGTSFIFTSIAYGVIIGISNSIEPRGEKLPEPTFVEHEVCQERDLAGGEEEVDHSGVGDEEDEPSGEAPLA